MRVLISGSTGMIGSALATRLRQQGDDVAALVRPGTRIQTQSAGSQSNIVHWDPIAGTLDRSADGANALVHLAGASIAGGRWTSSRKRLLRDSRIAATHNLIDELKKLKRPPRVFVAASAIGFYGDRGDEELTESSAPGEDFLADLTRQWEEASSRASEFGARVVLVRIGIVLAKEGGALPRMTTPFRLGVGGRLGTGRQWMSWVALEDLLAIIQYAMHSDSITGPINAVAPRPVRNSEFTRVLAKVLHRPALFPAPAFALRLALGEMADALLLSSQKVLPKKLASLGYHFAYPDLEAALWAIFRTKNASGGR